MKKMKNASSSKPPKKDGQVSNHIDLDTRPRMIKATYRAGLTVSAIIAIIVFIRIFQNQTQLSGLKKQEAEAAIILCPMVLLFFVKGRRFKKAIYAIGAIALLQLVFMAYFQTTVSPEQQQRLGCIRQFNTHFAMTIPPHDLDQQRADFVLNCIKK